jgi:hypothetical protein
MIVEERIFDPEADRRDLKSTFETGSAARVRMHWRT